MIVAFAMLITGLSPVMGAEPVRHVVLISIDGLPASFLTDQSVVLESIRGLARQGTSSEGMTITDPTITWPNHTTLVTGVGSDQHGVIFNGVMRRGGLGLPIQLDARVDQSQLVHVKTLADVLSENGQSVVAINWPCTRNSTSFLANFPDTPDALNYTTPELIDAMIEARLVPEDIRDCFKSLSPIVHDRIWTDAACLALKKYRPAFTMLHLLEVDAAHHNYGPKTLGGNAAVAYADACVGKVLKTLDETGMRDSTAIFVVSDHGFISIPKTINPNIALRKAGLLTVEGNRIVAATAQSFPIGGCSMVYLTRPDTQDENRRQVIELFQNVEGIAEILTPDQFPQLGMPHPDDYPQMADLILVGKDGYGFKDRFTGDAVVSPSVGTLGTHGFRASNPRMNAIFVASGAGIRSGVELDLIKNTSIAPTIAHLLKIDFPGSERVLHELLMESQP